MNINRPMGATVISSVSDHALLNLVQKLLREIQPQKRFHVSLASRLDRDLGLDSLSRAELLLRIEQEFRVRLPEKTLGEAETVSDLLKVLGGSIGRSERQRSSLRETETLPDVAAPHHATTLTEVLEWHATQHADRPHLTFLQEGDEPITLTYAQLAAAARNVSSGLAERNVSPGDRVAIMLPTCIEFFTCFFGVLYSGGIPVPIYPPARLSQLEEHVRRQSGILRNCGARLLITTERGKALAASIKPLVPGMDGAVSALELRSSHSSELSSPVRTGEIALLQYTSGSTGDPKGVVLSHFNLLANIRAMGEAMKAESNDVFVSWLPLYHDMGLIGAWLGSLYFGARLYIMSPLTFLAHPESWLWAVHRYRATLSAAPNFAFEMCASKIQDVDIEGLDLSSLRMVANGAEPVSAVSLRRFCDRFAAYGFRKEAMAPAFGLAENAVGLTFPPAGRGPVIDRVDRHALSSKGIARPAEANDPSPLELVGCGRPLPAHKIRIVDVSGRQVGERITGRLEFEGPSATSGYFQNEEKSRELFHDAWLDTGDEAYLANGELFITGRIKDIVIRAGRHYYPQELEEPISRLPLVVRTGVALFGTADSGSGTERIVLAIETLSEDEASIDDLRQKIKELSETILGQPVDHILFVAPDTIPRTENGKIRRSAAKALFESGKLGEPQKSLSQQRLRIRVNAILALLGNQVRAIGELFYAAWWWVIVGGAAATCWLAVIVLPGLRWRWRAVRYICRVGLFLVGARLRVDNNDGLSALHDAVLVANHSSYADALALGAAIPGEPLYVAKREFADQTFAGPFLRRLGVIFVERRDLNTSIADAERMGAMVRQGRVLVVFPEGTFSGQIGLMSFHLGAFKVASDLNVPVIPVTIRGTRHMMRGDQWWPRWSRITLSVSEPILPDGHDFSAAVRLRDRARAAILARTNEPDLEVASAETDDFD